MDCLQFSYFYSFNTLKLVLIVSLVCKYASLNSYRFSFFVNSIFLWNSLPATIAHSYHNYSIFKSNLKTYYNVISSFLVFISLIIMSCFVLSCLVVSYVMSLFLSFVFFVFVCSLFCLCNGNIAYVWPFSLWINLFNSKNPIQCCTCNNFLSIFRRTPPPICNSIDIAVVCPLLFNYTPLLLNHYWSNVACGCNDFTSAYNLLESLTGNYSLI